MNNRTKNDIIQPTKYLPLAVVVLAAGKGKRMKSEDLPKVLALLDGKPLIHHVLDTIANLEPSRTVVVVGYRKQMVVEYITSTGFEGIEFAIQDQQLGTGHAVNVTRHLLERFEGNILIIYGDTPLLRHNTLKGLIDGHQATGAGVTLLSALAPDPAGYGRVVRDSDGKMLRIVEEKDASDQQRRVNEINAAIYIIKSDLLFPSLERLQNDNAQSEYYLTDIIEILRNDGEAVNVVVSPSFAEIQGINSPEELARAEAGYINRQ